MSILIICQKLAEDDDLLGAFVAWVRAIAKNVDHVDVVCLGVGEYKLPDNVKVYSLGKESGAPHQNKFGAGQVGRLGRWFNFIKLMFKLMPKNDVVFSHMCPIFSIASWPFARLYRKKATLWYAHGHVSFKLRVAEKMVDTIFTSTEQGCRIVSDKVRVVGQGIDMNIFKPINIKKTDDGGQRTDIFKIVSVGRIAPSKDYETMIKAVEVLVKGDSPVATGVSASLRDIEVKVIGKANLKEHEEYFGRIKQMVKDKGLGEQIKFVGVVPNSEVVKYYQEADLYLNMSHTGSLDRAIIEAMACGCLVLTCNEAARGTLDNVGLNWLMYGKGDHGQLADKILEIKKLETKKLDEIGRKLREEVVENHSVERLGRKIIDNL
ncbi:glycosyltransferase family 4 protein [Candidatus Falkowbacteria bacterium]|nr:glycosyltransferase family 4 protein [Candidatus Falkowbacteria bacterium]